MKKIYENTFNVSSDSHVSYERLKEWINSAIDHLKRVPGSNHYKIASGGKFIEVTRGVDIDGDGKRTFEVLIVENGYRKEIYQEDEPEAKIIPLNRKFEVYPDPKWDYEHNHPKEVYLDYTNVHDAFPGQKGMPFTIHCYWHLQVGVILKCVNIPPLKLRILEDHKNRSYTVEFINSDLLAWVPIEALRKCLWTVEYPNQRA